MKPKKKRNPADLTLRNLRAIKKRLDNLEFCLGTFISWSEGLGYGGKQQLNEILFPKKKKS